MKQRQFITTVSLIITLAGLSPMVAAEAVRTSEIEPSQPHQITAEVTNKGALSATGNEKSGKIVLTSAEMDDVKGGWIMWVVRAVVFVATRGDHH